MKFISVFMMLCAACSSTEPSAPTDAARNNTDGRAVVVDSGVVDSGMSDAACVVDNGECATELFDSNGDGCLNECCDACPPDFVANNGYRIEGDQCMPNGCADAPCTPDMQCQVYGCGLGVGCEEPVGICAPFYCRPGDERCSNLEEQSGDPVCGCDGNTYINECALQCINGTLEHFGACE